MSEGLEQVYERRFENAEIRLKHEMWSEICRYLQRYVTETATVLDLACDRGYFINNIRAHSKWASDIRDVSTHLDPDVRFVQEDGLNLGRLLPPASFDVVFMSNYLEHLASGDDVIEQMRVVRALLRPDGRAMVLQPNARLLGGSYWDFIDHRVALTERSLVEAAELAGLETIEVVKRFLPYTTKGRLPVRRQLVRAYLALRPAWLLFGRQTLYVGKRSS